MEINRYIEHTLLKADASKQQINELCQQAIKYDFLAVCINPTWVSYCKELLKDKHPMVCTVIGFPLGATSTAAKVQEAKAAVIDGADELDMVINIGYLKSGMYKEVVRDISAVVMAAQNNVVKVIIETCLLTDDEKRLACQAVLKAKAALVKTSTGFSTAGATVADVALMKEVVKEEAGIKAAGGVANLDDFYAMVKAGATRIGTSKGVALMEMLKGCPTEIKGDY